MNTFATDLKTELDKIDEQIKQNKIFNVHRSKII